jgi:hypothetical protein
VTKGLLIWIENPLVPEFYGWGSLYEEKDKDGDTEFEVRE